MGVPVYTQKFWRLIDEMSQTLVPSSIEFGTSRFDTAAKYLDYGIYDSDRINFKVMGKRSYIREARTGEFDLSPSKCATDVMIARTFPRVTLPNAIIKRLKRDIPRLWVLVENNNGTHHVTAIYRGNPLWKIVSREGYDVAEFKSDEEFQQAIEQIQACNGFDVAAWKIFYGKYWDAALVEAMAIPDSSDGRVN